MACGNPDSLILKLSAKNIPLEQVYLAIEYMKKYHFGQKRLSGEDYYIHPTYVASIVSEYTYNVNAIVAALLHDILEDSRVLFCQIQFMFGSRVANTVDALSKIDAFLNKKSRLSEDQVLNQLYSKDDEVILIKLADRLHNIRTIAYHSPEKQVAIAMDTIKTYIPLAKVIGNAALEEELHKLTSKILETTN